MPQKDMGGSTQLVAELNNAYHRSMSLPEDLFIFVSYSSKDSYFVHPEIKRLERQGYKIWYDKGKLKPGRLWDEEIHRAIGACACFIVFITHNSVASENVCDEIDKALKAGKPLICIYWDKVELPDHFEKPIRSIQGLERYDMHRLEIEYEEPLSRALSEYIKKTEFPPEDKDGTLEKAPVLPSPDIRPDLLPKLVFFVLIVLGVIFIFLAVVAFVAPYISSTIPGDPLNSRLAGFLTGLFLIAIALGLGGAAFAVHRIYLRRKNG